MLRRLARGALLAAGFGLSACASSPPPPVAAPRAAPALATTTIPARTIHVHEGGLAEALTEARMSHRLVFVDLWASWCPPCMAMRAFAFDDPKLQPMASDVVWVALDGEAAEGSEAAERWNVHGLPTVLVIDPETGLPRARWSGPLSGEEIAILLRTVTANPLPDGAAEVFGPTPILRHDDEPARAARVRADAALDRLATSAPLAPFLVHELVMGAKAREDFARCAQLARAWSDRLPDVGLTVDIALAGEECAEMTTPARDESVHHLQDRAGAIAESLDASVLPLQRAYALFTLRGLHQRQGDADGAEAIRRRWWTFLQGEWAHADIARRNALAFPMEFWLDRQGDFAAAADALATIARESPDDVDALRRWAAALGAAGRVDEGVAAIEHGLSAITVDHRLPALAEEATLLRAKKDGAAEARVLDAALLLPRPEHSSPHLESLRTEMTKRREELRSSHDGARTSR